MFKRGCFLRTVSLLIIFAAVLVYLFDKYGKDFYESSKEKFYKGFVTELENQIANISTDAISDSLKNNFKDKIASIRETDFDKSREDVKNIISDIKNYVENNTDQIQNFDELLKIIKDYEQNEKD